MRVEHTPEDLGRSPVVPIQEVRGLVIEQLGQADWRVEPPADGWSKAAFLAERPGQRVFVKFDVAVPALQRLAELGVTPAIVRSGAWQDRSFVMQEFIAGSYPDRAWFPDHLPELARLLRTYHQDQGLKGLLPEARPYGELVIGYVDALRTRAMRAFSQFDTPEVRATLAEFSSQAGRLIEADLAPTHGDPNSKNFLLAGDRTYLIDWDDLALSDPLRDVGPLLWWYVPPERWSEFFEHYGSQLDNAVRDRLFWWTAEESLDVALSLHEKSHAGAEEFLEDFRAAVQYRENPHAQ